MYPNNSAIKRLWRTTYINTHPIFYHLKIFVSRGLRIYGNLNVLDNPESLINDKVQSSS